MSGALTAALVVFVATYFLIVTEKIDRVAAAILGAAVVVFFRLIPYEVALERVDLNVVFLLVGMMIVVNILSDTGLFEWVAVVIAQLSRGRGMFILVGLVTATAVLSAFLDNVTTVVLIAPITILITQILELPAIPFLILEALFSNVGGTATLIGDPPNILIGSKAELSFNQFLYHLTPAVVVVMLVLLLIVYLFQRRAMHVAEDARRRIMKAVPSRAITDPVRLRRGLPVFFAILAGFSLSHVLHVEPGLIGLAGGLLMVLVTRGNLREALERVEWETILFLIGLFMLVGALEYNGLFEMMGGGLFGLTEGNFLAATVAVLWLSGILSAILGAIPVAIALIPLVASMEQMFQAQAGSAFSQPSVLWWALALGACFGGNGTILGAAANVVVVQLGRKNNYNISFFQFARLGLPVMFISLGVATLYLYVRYFAFV